MQRRSMKQQIQEDQVRSSSNPAFRNLPRGGTQTHGQYGPPVGFNQTQGGVPGYGPGQVTSGDDDRPMTVDDVVVKTGMSLGVALLAIIGTVGVFIGLLVLYKTGAVKETTKLTKWIVGAVVGVAILMLFNLVSSFAFGFNPLRDGSPLAIAFSILCIGIAAFSFLLDFDQADRMIREGMPSKWAWYTAFGLMTTLVWLYLEILRLLSYLRENTGSQSCCEGAP